MRRFISSKITSYQSIQLKKVDENRSQAIYGGLVETFGPYSRRYTTTLFNFIRNITCISYADNKKTRTLMKKIFLKFVKSTKNSKCMKTYAFAVSSIYSHSMVAGGLLVMS